MGAFAIDGQPRGGDDDWGLALEDRRHGRAEPVPLTGRSAPLEPLSTDRITRSSRPASPEATPKSLVLHGPTRTLRFALK